MPFNACVRTSATVCHTIMQTARSLLNNNLQYNAVLIGFVTVYCANANTVVGMKNGDSIGCKNEVYQSTIVKTIPVCRSG